MCPVIQLADSWENFLKPLSSNARYQIRRYDKRTYHEKHKVFELKRIKDEDRIVSAFEKLVEQHQARWNDLGLPGAFSEIRMKNFFK